METPELNKIRKVSEISQEIGNFLDWLESLGYHIAEYKKFDEFDEPRLSTTYLNTEELLARYFKIDLKKAEEERVKILERIREKNNSQQEGLNKE